MKNILVIDDDLDTCNFLREIFEEQTWRVRTAQNVEAALAAGIWDRGTPPELGEVIAGQKQGRRSEADITICDLTGTGVQDTAIATHVRARFPSAGTTIHT